MAEPRRGRARRGRQRATSGIDVYANDSCDPSGYGEGQTYLGSTSVTTNGSGNATFALITLLAVTAGQVLTATTSDTTSVRPPSSRPAPA
ncbi:MAG: hypothetical protein IT306_05305 [Chloroflexi bacterium]|nr:hypothetical protein [Chloroflexota bacterium]